MKPEAKEIKEVSNGRYVLGTMVGKGAFGQIYKAMDNVNKKEVAVKIESKTSKSSQLQSESRVYKMLSGGGVMINSVGIPQMYYFGTEGDSNVMVIDLLGPSLEEIAARHKHHCFSQATVLMIGIKAIERLEYVHSKSVIHRDIKPDNFLIGIGKKINEIYLIDFGLARRYRDQKTKIHIPYRDNKSLTGTARYASINTHLGIEQSRRDDLECLAYVLLYLIRGSLPWQGLKGILPKEKHASIMEKKMEVSPEMLGKSYSNELTQFLNYSKSLKFDDKPNYNFIYDLFNTGLLNISRENILFDWEFKKDPSLCLEDIADETDGKKIVVPYANFINNEKHFNKNKKRPMMYNVICSGLDMGKLSKLLLQHAAVSSPTQSTTIQKMQTLGHSSKIVIVAQTDK